MKKEIEYRYSLQEKGIDGCYFELYAYDDLHQLMDDALEWLVSPLNDRVRPLRVVDNVIGKVIYRINASGYLIVCSKGVSV